MQGKVKDLKQEGAVMGLVTLNSPKGKLLRNPSEPVDDIASQVSPFIEEAISIIARVDGIGLAAPQMGVMRRWYVDKLGKVYINPEITESSDVMSITEGCLSLPDRWYLSERASNLTLKFTSIDGDEETLDFSGTSAYMVQHEVDHLNGILVSDHAERLYKDDFSSMGIE
jgi:peptide deformylase